MDKQQAVAILIRAARRCADERDGLLEVAEALTTGGLRNLREESSPSESAGEIDFPLEIFLDAPEGRVIGLLNSDGSVDVGNVHYSSSSNAASQILGYSENGWRVWRFRRGENEVPLDTLRKMGHFQPKRRRGWA